MDCENCVYYVYDEDEEDWFCEADVDQDDLIRLMEGGSRGCRFWRSNDEYAVVRHQM